MAAVAVAIYRFDRIPQDSLFGAKAPERHVVVYGADQETWPCVMAALRKGDRADGDVTLVLERHAPPPDG